MDKLFVVVGDIAIDALKNKVGIWEGVCIDLHKGKRESFAWSDEQMAAVLNLGIFSVGEENTEGYDKGVLYHVASKAIKNFDPEVCPIP